MKRGTMKNIKNHLPALILLLVYAAISLVLFLQVPADAQLPMHWNAKGEVDGYASAGGALAFALILPTALFLLLLLLPYYSPKYRAQAERFEKVLPKMNFLLVFFFGLINLYILAYPMIGDKIKINFIFLLIGFMFAFLGNLIPKVPRNFFIGIRTPWSITDEDNWYHTHRVGAKAFLLGGLLLIIAGFLPQNSIVASAVFILVTIIVLYPVLYSFILFKKKGE